MRIAIDTKNLALFTGGISAFIKPLIKAWIEEEQNITFVLVGPAIDTTWLGGLSNFRLEKVTWPIGMPRKLRHPFYDLFLFPRAVKKIKPDLIFTPYHDVLLPKGIPAVMMIHDTCLIEQCGVYPKSIRFYYETMLKKNLKRARNIITVSNTSKLSIIKHYQVEEDRIDIVPNAFDPPSGSHYQPVSPLQNKDLKLQLFYPGGADFRKNVKALAYTLIELEKMGHEVDLRVTGDFEGPWERELRGINKETISKISFLGYISKVDLFKEYANADVIVYPSLCEGFGRVCLEAMAIGVPLACSDLPVLREVSQNYAIYFDPLNVKDIAAKVLLAKAGAPKSRIIREEFSKTHVCGSFVTKMKALVNLL